MESLGYIIENIRAIIQDFLRTPEGDLNVFGKVLSIMLIFLVVRIIVFVMHKIVDRTIKSRVLYFKNEGRSTTLSGIIKKIIKYVLFFIAIVMSLELIGIRTGSILATAGIGGLAISFGAQSLVKDIITGFFIIMEEQFNVGDHVKILDYEGYVEELGIRVTKVRGFAGDLHIIPNGTIQDVSNMTRGAMRSLVDISIGYDENIDEVVKVLEDICQEIKDSNNNILEGPNVLGVTDLGDSDVKITVIAKTVPGLQWAIEREIRKRVKERFDKEQIEIPYPKQQVLFRGVENDS